MLEFLETVTLRKSELSLALGQLDRSGFEQPGPGLLPANTCCAIYDRFGYLLDTLDLSWLDATLFAEVIHNKGAPLEQCWVFIDGTPRSMARPTRNNYIMFSGHKRVHCIKFQVSYHSTLTSLFGYVLSRFSLSFNLVCLKFVFLFFLVRPSSQWFDCKYV